MSSLEHLWLSDGVTQLFTKFELNGKLLYNWAAFPEGLWGVHQFSVDEEGNLYTADVHIGRPQKFRPRADADPAMLVGRAVRVAHVTRSSTDPPTVESVTTHPLEASGS